MNVIVAVWNVLDGRWVVARWCGKGWLSALVFAVRGCWREWRAGRLDFQGRDRLGL
jgi:hypothetical protein